jgi:hypothetical protein
LSRNASVVPGIPGEALRRDAGREHFDRAGDDILHAQRMVARRHERDLVGWGRITTTPYLLDNARTRNG